MSKRHALRTLKQRRRIEVLERQLELQVNPDVLQARDSRQARRAKKQEARA